MRYVVIGKCYIHGLAEGEPLLGPLPPGWRCGQIAVAGAGYMSGYFNRETRDHTLQDPRPGALSLGWRFESSKLVFGLHDYYDWLLNQRPGKRYNDMTSGSTDDCRSTGRSNSSSIEALAKEKMFSYHRTYDTILVT